MKTQRIILLLSLMLLPILTYSQNILQEDADSDLEQAAREAAEKWTVELAMSAKQTALMEKELVEYALKKRAVLQSKMKEEAKTERLLRLELAENKSMRDILTKPQYEQYLFLLRQEVNQKQASKNKETSDDPSEVQDQ